MDDTTSEITAMMQEMIRNKTPLERVRMGASMFESSRQLVLRAILEENPDISPAALKQELFIKFYGQDVNPKEREAILDHLSVIVQ